MTNINNVSIIKGKEVFCDLYTKKIADLDLNTRYAVYIDRNGDVLIEEFGFGFDFATNPKYFIFIGIYKDGGITKNKIITKDIKNTEDLYNALLGCWNMKQ